jgi:hypothetical protein
LSSATRIAYDNRRGPVLNKMDKGKGEKKRGKEKGERRK